MDVNSEGIPLKGGIVINFGNKDWVWMYKGMLCIGLDSKGDGWDSFATLMQPCPKGCQATQSLQSQEIHQAPFLTAVMNVDDQGLSP